MSVTVKTIIKLVFKKKKKRENSWSQFRIPHFVCLAQKKKNPESAVFEAKKYFC